MKWEIAVKSDKKEARLIHGRWNYRNNEILPFTDIAFRGTAISATKKLYTFIGRKSGLKLLHKLTLIISIVLPIV